MARASRRAAVPGPRTGGGVAVAARVTDSAQAGDLTLSIALTVTNTTRHGMNVQVRLYLIALRKNVIDKGHKLKYNDCTLVRRAFLPQKRGGPCA